MDWTFPIAAAEFLWIWLSPLSAGLCSLLLAAPNTTRSMISLRTTFSEQHTTKGKDMNHLQWEDCKFERWNILLVFLLSSLNPQENPFKKSHESDDRVRSADFLTSQGATSGLTHTCRMDFKPFSLIPKPSLKIFLNQLQVDLDCDVGCTCWNETSASDQNRVDSLINVHCTLCNFKLYG